MQYKITAAGKLFCDYYNSIAYNTANNIFILTVMVLISYKNKTKLTIEIKKIRKCIL